MSFPSPEIVEALGLTVMDALWQGALLLLLGLVFVSLFKKASARLKYRVLVAMMLAFPVCSVLSFQAHYTPTSSLETIDFQPIEASDSGMISTESFSANTIETTTTWFEKTIMWMESNANLAAYFWLIGVSVFGIRLLGGLTYVSLIRHNSLTIGNAAWLNKLNRISNDFGLKAKVGLRESAKITSPIVIGYLKPIIIFPIGLIQGLPTDQIEAIIAHEVAHIKRLDYLMNLLLSALQVIYFFHPAYWWLYRQAEQEREYHCDQMAIDYIGNKIIFIKALTSVQELRNPGLIPSVAFARGKNQLLERILRIAEDRPKTNWLSGLISMFMIVSAFTLMSWQNAHPTDQYIISEEPAEKLVIVQDTTTKVFRTPFSLTEKQSDTITSVTEDSLLRFPFEAPKLDTIPNSKNKQQSDEYQKALIKYKQTRLRLMTSNYYEGREKEAETILEQSAKLLGQDTVEINNEMEMLVEDMKAIQQQVNAFGNSIQLRSAEDEKLPTPDSYTRLEQHFEQIQRQFAAAENVVGLSRMELAMKELRQLESLVRLGAEKNDEYLKLRDKLENTKFKFQRRIDILLKNQEAREYNQIQVEARWNEQGLNAPMKTRFLSLDYFITEYNVTQKHLDNDIYKLNRVHLNFYPSDVLILDGKEVELSREELFNRIGITRLRSVELIRGKLAEAIVGRSLNHNPRVTRIMTKEYASSAQGKAQMNRAMELHDQELMGFEKIIDFENVLILINGEKRNDLRRRDLFDIYGKRYSAYLNIGRGLAKELYSSNFLGQTEFLFLPFIDGKNSSVDDFYRRLEDLNKKINRTPDNYSKEIIASVKDHLEAKSRIKESSEILERESQTLKGYLIVLNQYVRKDLTLEDLKKMDIESVNVIKRESALPLYGSHMTNESGVLLVESQTSQVIEYGNVMDPRSLKENQNPFTLPPYQSENREFDQSMEEQLIKDKLIDIGAENTIFLEGEKMLINYAKQPNRVLRKYLKLYEKTLGFPLNKNITYYYKK